MDCDDHNASFKSYISWAGLDLYWYDARYYNQINLL